MQRHFVFLIMLQCVFISYVGFSQDSPGLPVDTNKINHITLSTQKINNIFTFSALSFIDKETPFGRFIINQAYYSTAYDTYLNSFRDDENLLFEYSLPVSGMFNIITRQNWIYGGQDKQFDIDGLNRYDGLSGIRLTDNNMFSVEISGGLHSINQSGVKSTGSMFNSRGNLNDLELFDFRINSGFFGEYRGLTDDRNYSDLNYTINLLRDYDENNNLQINFGYISSHNDNITSLIVESNRNQVIEERENRIFTTGLGLNFLLSKGFTGSMNLSLYDENRTSSYKQPIESISATKIQREKNRIDYNISSELMYKLSSLSQTVGISYNSRDEKYLVNKLYNISARDEDEIRRQESMLDRSSSVIQLSSRTTWLPSTKDSLKFIYTVSLSRNDTPSEEVNDDNDIYTNIISSIYSHRFSTVFNAFLLAEAQLTHSVYIKSARSANNNWLRELRLSPFFTYKTKHISLQPQFLISAKYLVYDFENLSSGSYSFRELAYKDSIFIILEKSFNLQLKINTRYFEDGVLYWDTFSESPVRKGYEIYTKALVFSDLSDNLIIGSGLRFYNLSELNKINSIGPETIINLKTDNGSGISLQGWLVFQKTNNESYKMIPNVILQTNYNL